MVNLLVDDRQFGFLARMLTFVSDLCILLCSVVGTVHDVTCQISERRVCEAVFTGKQISERFCEALFTGKQISEEGL